MRITYDRSVDAAYIYLVDKIESGGAASTYVTDIQQAHGMINLDFDRDGKLVGLELLNASRQMREEILKSAEIIGG